MTWEYERIRFPQELKNIVLKWVVISVYFILSTTYYFFAFSFSQSCLCTSSILDTFFKFYHMFSKPIGYIPEQFLNCFFVFET